MSSQTVGSRALAALLICAASAGAKAQPPDDGASDENAFEVHGLVSQGFLKSTQNNYLAGSRRGSFEFSEVALNVGKPLGQTLRLAAQLFARDLGPLGDYTARFDWFFLDWRAHNWLGLRAGRVKLPYGLYNQESDYDPGRLWVLMPQSVYPITQRDVLVGATGVELYGYVPLGGGGALSWSALGGTLFLEPERPAVPVQRANVQYLAFGRLFWETPLQGLKMGVSALSTRVHLDAMLQGQPLSVRAKVLFALASVELERGDLLVAAEYARQFSSQDSTRPALAPPVSVVAEGYHVDVSRYLSKILAAGVYYAGLFRDVHHRSGRAAYQHDVAATVRVDLTQYWLLKFEAHYLNGTALLDPSLNGGRPRSELTPSWGLFLLKTTAYF